MGNGTSTDAVVSKKSVRDADIGMVSQDPNRRMKKAGSGKITIDSGAGESVSPIDMVPGEPLHQTPKNGTWYRAAGGQSLINHGEKRIKFMAGDNVAKLHFQAIHEVKKPLVSAAKIANKGNIIVLDEEGGNSYIYNKVTEKSIPIRQENNVYVLGIEYMIDEPGDAVEVPYRRHV